MATKSSRRSFRYEINGKGASKEEGQAAALTSGRIVRDRFSRDRLQRRANRVDAGPPERRTVARAMLAVEERLVKALWVLERSAAKEGAVAFSSRNGVPYLPEYVDRYGQAIAGHEPPMPRPAQPVSKEISEAEKVKLWVLWLDPKKARVLSVGAMSKRGDAGRRVNWLRVRSRLPELADYSTRSLQKIYTDGLHDIVTELTLSHLSR